MAENKSGQERVNFLQPDTPNIEGGVEITASRENEQNSRPENAEEMSLTDSEKKKKRIFLPRKIKEIKKSTPTHDEKYIRVEKILEEDMREQYEKMSPIARQEFKLRGEETTYAILELLQATHIRVKKIFHLIISWLALIPGVNRFFLEQEAKIKTDKIIAIKKTDGT